MIVEWVMEWVGRWLGGGVVGPHVTPIMGASDAPMLFVDNLVKNLTKISKNNMGASWGVSDAPIMGSGTAVGKVVVACCSRRC